MATSRAMEPNSMGDSPFAARVRAAGRASLRNVRNPFEVKLARGRAYDTTEPRTGGGKFSARPNPASRAAPSREGPRGRSHNLYGLSGRNVSRGRRCSGQRLGVGALAARDARAVGGLFDFARDGLGHALVEDGRDDVFGVALVVGDDGGDGLRGGELHLLVDARGAAGQRAAEDAGEAEHVVDLVRVVRAARG